MKFVCSAGMATLVIGLMAGCASQTQPSENVGAVAAPEVNVTNDLTHRYGEVQIAVNPKNPNNLVYAINKMAYTYACQAAKDPNCEIVPMSFGGGGGSGQGRTGNQGAGQARAGNPGPDGNPRPPANLGAAARNLTQPRGMFYGDEFDTVGVFTSFDRGKTWKHASVPIPSPQYPDLKAWGDPSVVSTPDGTFYLSYDNMDWGTPDKPLRRSIVGVSKSTDGGLTWTGPVPSGTGIDGPKMTVDLNTGTIYEASGTNRQLVMSKDGATWSKPQRIAGSDGTRPFTLGIGGNSMSAAHGMLAFAFRATDAAACTFYVGGPAPCVVFQTTTDAGLTWSRHGVPATAPMGNPTMAADPSKKDHFTVAVFNQGDTQFQVFQTNDAGKTWSGPTTLAEDSTKQHYHPWAAYSPDGVFGLVWRTRQGHTVEAPSAAPAGPGDGPSTPYNIWAAISRDGGATFSAPLKVDAADSPAPQPGLFGNNGDDYTGLTLDGGYLYAGWADWRPGDRQGFFRAVGLTEFKAKSKH